MTCKSIKIYYSLKRFFYLKKKMSRFRNFCFLKGYFFCEQPTILDKMPVTEFFCLFLVLFLLWKSILFCRIITIDISGCLIHTNAGTFFGRTLSSHSKDFDEIRITGTDHVHLCSPDINTVNMKGTNLYKNGKVIGTISGTKNIFYNGRRVEIN